MSDIKPLNARLYASLMRAFGEVKISNEGQSFHGRLVNDPIRGGARWKVIEAGEQYRVNCPFCPGGDTKQHLYISHKWNTKDDKGAAFGRYMVNCFKKDCFHTPTGELDWEHVRELEDSLKPYISQRPKLMRRAGDSLRVGEEVFKEVTLPGVCVPLNTLPVTHPAREYVAARKFSADELTQDWGVCYCEKHEHPYIRNRIVVPIYNEHKLVGWQARKISESGEGPKYFTAPGLKKAKMLFNGDRAKTYDFGVVVEGVFDAFRVGPRAVALLGKSMNTFQQQLAHRWWSNGSICLLLDPDAIEDMERISKLLSAQAYRWGSFSVLLPEGKDPADMQHGEVWEMITTYARNRGIKIFDCAGGSGRRSAGAVSGK